MSWFGGNSEDTASLELKINDATSESIPNGEIDLSVGLEITDIIRSKKVGPQQSMRLLKKRLTKTYQNPNLVTLTLKLVDLCVKNGGMHFLIELSSKEFMDYLVDYIFIVHYNTQQRQVIENEAKFKVGSLILSLINDWRIAFENQPRLAYVEKCYHTLMQQGFEFPRLESEVQKLTNNFIESEVPPDWVEGNECMICYSAFSMLNRKHHCRACGGVFCQTHSSNMIPLPSLGITDLVRVCDNCYEKQHIRNSKGTAGMKPHHLKSRSISGPAHPNIPDDEDEQLRRALELSLQDSQNGAYHNVPTVPETPGPGGQEAQAQQNKQQTGHEVEENEDEEMKAAIAASLKAFEEEKRLHGHSNTNEHDSSLWNAPAPAGSLGPEGNYYQSQQQEQDDLYKNLLPGSRPPMRSSGATAGSRSSFQQGRNEVPQAPQQPQHTPKIESLSQKDEESVNLFVTLMNSIKSDPSKQTSVIYDSNLSELYTKVVQLKPKVNRALRAAIQRYELFLDLSTKILAISRLYDQYLDSQLSQAYSSHHMNPPVTNERPPMAVPQLSYTIPQQYSHDSPVANDIPIPSHSNSFSYPEAYGSNQYMGQNVPSAPEGPMGPTATGGFSQYSHQSNALPTNKHSFATYSPPAVHSPGHFADPTSAPLVYATVPSEPPMPQSSGQTATDDTRALVALTGDATTRFPPIEALNTPTASYDAHDPRASPQAQTKDSQQLQLPYPNYQYPQQQGSPETYSYPQHAPEPRYEPPTQLPYNNHPAQPVGDPQAPPAHDVPPSRQRGPVEELLIEL